MENRILARLGGRVDPEWLLTLLSVLPLTKEKGPHAEPRHTNGKRGEHMENRILARLGGRVDPEWLLTLLSVLPLNTYTLEEWNEALSQAAGRRIFCPSYRTLSDYLHLLPVLPDVIRLFTPAGFRSTIAL